MRLPGKDAEKMGIKPKEIRDDLGRAIEKYAVTDDHALRSVEALLGDLRFRPTEKDIRDYCHATVAHQEHAYETAPKCQLCDGNKFVTVWRLVTYRGNSYSIEKSEALPCKNYEEAMVFAKKIAANPGSVRQVVNSAAKGCACRTFVGVEA